jgi:hypothetical protein
VLSSLRLPSLQKFELQLSWLNGLGLFRIKAEFSLQIPLHFEKREVYRASYFCLSSVLSFLKEINIPNYPLTQLLDISLLFCWGICLHGKESSWKRECSSRVTHMGMRSCNVIPAIAASRGGRSSPPAV